MEFRSNCFVMPLIGLGALALVPTCFLLTACGGVKFNDPKAPAAEPAPPPTVQAQALPYQIIPLAEPNHYQIRLKNPGGNAWVVVKSSPSMQNAQLILATHSDAVSDDQVTGGNRYTYELKPTSDGETQYQATINVPNDRVFAETTVLTSDSQLKMTGGRLFFKKDAKLMTLGHGIDYDLDEVNGENAKIVTFAEGEPFASAALGQPGMNAEPIHLKIKHIVGHLDIISRGQRGGRGLKGAPGLEGAKGAGGHLQNYLSNPNLMFPTCGPPLPGATGGPGFPGSMGMPGGIPAQVTLDIPPEELSKVTVTVLPGEGGLGGEGGDGGLGGLSGDNLDVTNRGGSQGCVVSTHQDPKYRSESGPKGSEGAVGAGSAMASHLIINGHEEL